MSLIKCDELFVCQLQQHHEGELFMCDSWIVPKLHVLRSFCFFGSDRGVLRVRDLWVSSDFTKSLRIQNIRTAPLIDTRSVMLNYLMFRPKKELREWRAGGENVQKVCLCACDAPGISNSSCVTSNFKATGKCRKNSKLSASVECRQQNPTLRIPAKFTSSISWWINFFCLQLTCWTFDSVWVLLSRQSSSFFELTRNAFTQIKVLSFPFCSFGAPCVCISFLLDSLTWCLFLL